MSTKPGELQDLRLLLVPMGQQPEYALHLGNAVALLARRGITALAVRAVTDPADLQSTVQAVVAAHDCRLIVVGGGDGTVSEVVDLPQRPPGRLNADPRKHCDRRLRR